MNAFRKWWKKHISKDELKGSDYRAGTRAGWRAALGEVLTQIENDNKANCIVAKDCVIVNWIKEELI